MRPEVVPAFPQRSARRPSARREVRAMSPSRRSSPSTPDYNRLMARVEEGQLAITERLELLADSLDKRLGRIERDLAEGEQGMAGVRRELAEGRNDAGEMRDAVAKLRDEFEAHKGDPLEAAAAGAAKGAVAGAAGPLAEQLAPAVFKAGLRSQDGYRGWRRWALAWIAVCVGFVAVMTAGEKLPAFLRWLERVWGFLTGAHG